MDIKCVVCGEPWDAYGVNNGDMLDWEADLFKKGAGCPCCEGSVPEGERFHPESYEDVENGDGDPIERLYAYQDSIDGKSPKWVRPEPEVLWTCEGCGVQAIKSPDDGELEYYLPPNAPGAKWYHSHRYSRSLPEEKPAHVFDKDRPVCEFCLNHCDHCGKEICDTLSYDDTYEDGNSFPDGNSSFCVECFETICSECGCFVEDCQCNKENDNEEDEEE